MKRKGFQCLDDDFSSPSTKSRRLDGELLPFMQEDPGTGVPEVIDEGLLLEPKFTSSNLIQTNASTIDAMPLLNYLEEKAVVPYYPPDSLFLKYPSSAEFPIILDSDLLPGIKDHIYWPGNSNALKLRGDFANGSTESSDDCLAVVPWTASQIPMTALADRRTTGILEPMEADADVEMMDTEDTGTDSKWNGGLEEGAQGLQHWQQQQQHCMESQILQNASSPAIW